jgi:hypothetical protein
MHWFIAVFTGADRAGILAASTAGGGFLLVVLAILGFHFAFFVIIVLLVIAMASAPGTGIAASTGTPGSGGRARASARGGVRRSGQYDQATRQKTGNAESGQVFFQIFLFHDQLPLLGSSMSAETPTTEVGIKIP